VVGVIALVPPLELQLKGLGIIVSIASYGAISSTGAVWIGSAVVMAYVTVSGVRGAAWNAVVKDVLILAVAVFLGIYLPLHDHGGHGAMFNEIEQARPGFLALPAKGSSVVWFQSTVLLTAVGFFILTPSVPFTRRRMRAASAATRYFYRCTNCSCYSCFS